MKFARWFPALLVACLPILTDCGGGSHSPQPTPNPVVVSIKPDSINLIVRVATDFSATVSGSTNTAVTYAVVEGSTGGNITATGSYLAPATPGLYHVRATSVADPSKFADAVVAVRDYNGTVQRLTDAPDGFDYGTATLLDSGQVLIVGGRGLQESVHKTSYLYSASDQKFTPGPLMSTARFGHAAFLLPDGRVVVTGGDDPTVPVDPFRPALVTTEIYDSRTGKFSAGPNMTVPRFHHVATQLKDGRVLVTGGLQIAGSSGFGASPNNEIYDPNSNTFTATNRMVENGRWLHTATLLSDGRVLLVGGRNTNCDENCSTLSLKSAEIFDAARGMFTPTGPLNISRFRHTATLLNDGKVLIVGGQTTEDLGPDSDQVQQAEIYDPATGTFSMFASMLIPRGNHTVTELNNGKLLIMGGEIRGGTPTTSTELLDIDKSLSVAGPTLLETHIRARAIRLKTGEVLLLGGSAGYQPSQVVEIFR